MISVNDRAYSLVQNYCDAAWSTGPKEKRDEQVLNLAYPLIQKIRSGPLRDQCFVLIAESLISIAYYYQSIGDMQRVFLLLDKATHLCVERIEDEDIALSIAEKIFHLEREG